MAVDDISTVERLLPLDAAQKQRLTAYVDLVRKWQPSKNLISPATLGQIWQRHVADSVQAHMAAPEARVWVDIGSGGGFPGLVTAIMIADQPGARVHLCESKGGKVAFLRTVARELGLPVTIHDDRIEATAAKAAEMGKVDAVSARALAAFDELLAMAKPWLDRGAVGVFHKGQDFVSEHELATQSWAYDLLQIPSRTDPQARIVVVQNVSFRG